jgi:hypothetical protein
MLWISRMKWLRKLLGRPRESRQNAARPQSEEPTISERVGPGEFRPQPRDIVLAPARHNPVVKERAEVVELERIGSEQYAKVREAGSENEPWSVHYESLEALPD